MTGITVDALDTMILMELDDEVATTKKYILDNLSFDKDIEVQNFEITIRLLGALLTNYQLSGDKRLLSLAEDLGKETMRKYMERFGFGPSGPFHAARAHSASVPRRIAASWRSITNCGFPRSGAE